MRYIIGGFFVAAFIVAAYFAPLFVLCCICAVGVYSAIENRGTRHA